MDATLWTGTGSSLAITNAAGFAPDLVWIKSRSNAYVHTLEDTVRGVSKYIDSASTAAEVNDPTNFITAFNSNGFTQAGNSAVGGNGATYVGWQWKAGGTAVSNTSGTITSSVSANTTAGFSVVTYTGTGANATVGHGLGVAPSMIIIKGRSNAYSWAVYHTSLGNTKGIYLNETTAQSTDSAFWNNTSPTSSLFSLGNGYSLNKSSDTYVAYCWTPIAGYSAFGSYAGNGSTDGPFIYLGFRPKFVMVKRSDSTGNWILLDTSRTPYNYQTNGLLPNLSDAEQSTTGSWGWDFLSNGFKLRDNGIQDNSASGSYIYMAFAENPFKYANAR